MNVAAVPPPRPLTLADPDVIASLSTHCTSCKHHAPLLADHNLGVAQYALLHIAKHQLTQLEFSRFAVRLNRKLDGALDMGTML